MVDFYPKYLFSTVVVWKYNNTFWVVLGWKNDINISKTSHKTCFFKPSTKKFYILLPCLIRFLKHFKNLVLSRSRQIHYLISIHKNSFKICVCSNFNYFVSHALLTSSLEQNINLHWYTTLDNKCDLTEIGTISYKYMYYNNWRRIWPGYPNDLSIVSTVYIIR